MGLDLSLSGFISAGGGSAYALAAALWIASRGGGGRERPLFAGLLASTSILVIVQSLTTPDASVHPAVDAAAFVLVSLSAVATALFAGALALVVARRVSAGAFRAVGAALLLLAAMTAVILAQGGLAAAKGDPADSPAAVRIVFTLILVAYAATTLASGALAARWKTEGDLGSALLGAGIAVLPLAALMWGAGRSTGEALLALFGLCCILAWAPPWRRGSARLGLRVVLALLTLGLAYKIYPLVPGLPHPATALLPFNVLAALVITLALLREKPWGVEPPSLVVRRGPLAAAALALLFIVAQIAENFLDATYGLVMGGVVAGALLFAAHPVQRMIERSGSRGEGPGRRGAVPVGAHAAYRAAVRAALTDGPMSPEKEAHLADAAEHLGVGPRDALRIRREVEAEAGEVAP